MPNSRRLPLRFELLEDRLTPLSPPQFIPGHAIVPLAGGGFLTAIQNQSGSIELNRYDHDGQPVSDFGTDGKQEVWFDESHKDIGFYFKRLIPMADGSVLLAGNVWKAYWLGGDIGLIRLLADGSFDPTFDGDGRFLYESDLVGLSATSPSTAAVGSDGRIVVAGTIDVAPPSTNVIARDNIIFRLNADGSFDQSFGVDGKVFRPGYRSDSAYVDSPVQFYEQFNDLTVTAGGKIVLAAKDQNAPGFLAYRLNPDGSLDETFDGDGRADIAFPGDSVTLLGHSSTLRAIVQPDGNVILIGYRYTLSDYTVTAARLTRTGQLDTTYGEQGVIHLKVSGISDIPGGGVDAAGRLVVVISSYLPYSSRIDGSFESELLLKRITSDGQPDDSIGPGGEFVIRRSDTGLFRSVAVAVRPNGSVMVESTLEEYSDTGNFLFKTTMLDRVTPAGPLPTSTGFVAAAGGSVSEYIPGPFNVSSRLVHSPFPEFTGPVHAVFADVNGDGLPDTVSAVGPGGGSGVRIEYGAPTDGPVPTPLTFGAFEDIFTGGVFIASGDIDGDGWAEVVVSPDVGGGPRVRVFAWVDGQLVEKDNFFAIADAGFRGGVRVALGDVNGDGLAELIATAGAGGGPRVAVFDGVGLLRGAVNPPRLVNDFFAFPGLDAERLRDGIYVAAGDLNADGKADLVFGGGSGGAPRVLTLDGAAIAADPINAYITPLANFFAGDATLRGGVRVAIKDADSDGRADLITGSGPGEISRVHVYLTPNLLVNSVPIADQILDPFNAIPADGVFVG